MFNGLTGLFAIVIAVIVFIFGWYGYRNSRQGLNRPVLAGIVILLVAFSVGIYAYTGRFSEWQNAQVNVDTDPRLVAKITLARKAAAEQPNNPESLRELGELYLQGGLFGESAESFDKALQLSGPNARLYGMKARALYYRDKRELTSEVSKTINQALDLYPAEPLSRMLLAEHAYRRKDYKTAIREWKVIIDSHSSPGHELAIKKAIFNAEEKLAQNK